MDQRCKIKIACIFSKDDIFCDCRLYSIETKNPKVLGAILNSTISIFFAEFLGRQLGGGGGPRDVMTYEVKKLLIANPELIKNEKQKLIRCFTKLKDREIYSIFDEIGSNVPNEVSFEKVNSDRLNLDKIIMEDILGLNIEEQLDVYKAVVDLVKSRIDKAQSFGKKGKIEEGIDIDAIKKIVIKKMKEEEE